MIEQILQMLQIADFAGESEAIDIAKGKHKIEKGLKEFKNQLKREKAWRSRK